MVTPAIPDAPQRILDTFHHIARCPHTGWANTVCGSYQDIANAVNTRHGTAFTPEEIGWGMTWLHQWGPDVAGAFVSKVGPGNRKTQVQFDDPAKADVIIEGSVYMLVIDGVALPREKRIILTKGQIEWCDYRMSSLRNDIIDLSMTRGAYSSSDPANRSVRQTLRRTIDSLAAEIASIRVLRGELAKML